RIRKSGKAKFIGFSTHANMVPECMEAGAAAGFYDQVMFRVNFRTIATEAIDRALDKCSKAKMGLIAMKTLADGTNIPAKYDVFTKAGLNKRQAALKAIWADERIHLIVSEMVSIDQIAQNTMAAKSKLTLAEAHTLKQYATATDHLFCRGCDHLCRSAAGSVVAVADILRFKMYHDHYGKRDRAKELYAELETASRRLEDGDWAAAEAACPHNLPLKRLLVEATRTLS
ncbi:MAG: aldo/keto reductase, partial [Chthonomonadales bacterium]